jgi:hypothetical protein
MFHKFLKMFHLPAIFRKMQGFKMWSDIFQNHSKCFIDTFLHVINFLRWKMFHDFLGMFHFPAIFQKIQGFKLWSDFFPKALLMLYRHFPTPNEVFKVKNVP